MRIQQMHHRLLRRLALAQIQRRLIQQFSSLYLIILCLNEGKQFLP